MRIAIGVVALIVAAMIGLFIYGQLLQPETTLIEQEALRAAPDAQ